MSEQQPDQILDGICGPVLVYGNWIVVGNDEKKIVIRSYVSTMEEYTNAGRSHLGTIDIHYRAEYPDEYSASDSCEFLDDQPCNLHYAGALEGYESPSSAIRALIKGDTRLLYQYAWSAALEVSP
jgi:hypothetical protein